MTFLDRRLALACAMPVLGAAACGGPGASSHPTTSPTAPPTAQSAREGAPMDPVASLDAIAARGASAAPLMRESTRIADAAARATEVKAERDTCVRVAFAASTKVKTFLADAAGARRGDPFEGTEGVTPPSGPACMKRGESLRLVVEGAPAAAVVRAVVFVAP